MEGSREYRQQRRRKHNFQRFHNVDRHKRQYRLYGTGLTGSENRIHIYTSENQDLRREYNTLIFVYKKLDADASK